MACKHNRRHTCKKCRKAQEERQRLLDDAAAKALRGEKVDLPEGILPQRNEAMRLYQLRVQMQKRAERKAQQLLSRSKRRLADGKQEWPGLKLVEEMPEGLGRQLRAVKTKKYKIYGVYEMLDGSGKDAEGELVWHGTPLGNLESISKDHFRPSRHGMLGPGIYVTPSPAKAWWYAGSGLAKSMILARLVEPGKIFDVGRYSYRDSLMLKAQEVTGPVTIRAGANRTRWAWGGRHKPEYCVRYPSQLALVCAVILVKTI